MQENVLKECALGRIQALSPPRAQPAKPAEQSPERCPGEGGHKTGQLTASVLLGGQMGSVSFMGSQGRSQHAEMVREGFQKRRVVIILKW